MRRFAHESGLLAPPVHALAQDSAGFLWIGTQAGLFRYDGAEVRHWAPEDVLRPIVALAVSPRGQVAALDEAGTVFRVRGGGAEPMPAPPGRFRHRLPSLAFDAAERLWTVRGERIVRYERSRGWKAVPMAAHGDEGPRLLRQSPEGTVDVATEGGIWRLPPGDPPRKLMSARQIVDFLPLPDERVVALTFPGRVLERSGGVVRERWRGDGGGARAPRGVALALRGEKIWAALDRYLVALGAAEAPEVLGPMDGIEAGGPLLVDQEGSLWMGTFSSLLQLPEPETRIWTDRHGLPSSHTRYLARNGDVLWVTTWQGAGYLRGDSVGLRAATVSAWISRGPLCTDGRGVLWTSSGRGMLEIRGTAVLHRHPVAGSALLGCSGDRRGGLWLATFDGLWHAGARGGPPRRVDTPPLPEAPVVEAVLHDRAGRLWAAAGRMICMAPAASVLGGSEPSWTCEDVGETGKITSMVELPSGALWASTMRAGVLAHHDGRWEPLPANEELPTRAVFRLAPSPSGGWWMAGHGILQRIREDPPHGWRVLESLGAWHGLPSVGGGDIREEEDGTLWIATSLGLVQVPPQARFADPPPPRVALVDARVDDQAVADLSGPLRLPHDRNRLELRFVALSFRDPSLLRHQVRLSPQEPWSTARGQPVFRWMDLRPGAYRVELRSSLGGRAWSAAPAFFRFEVRPPWYLEPWALGVLALTAAILLWIAYRVRISFLVGLERQRTRIAMDLHDEVGSGLGSIGILSGVISADGLGDRERREMAQEISRTAEELGHSLSDIIWSLDPQTATLDELASRLAEHGARLFADDGADFVAELPGSWPAERLSLPVRRSVLLVGLEALHNAARHSGAGLVVLRLARRGSLWELCVRDDGVGLARGACGDHTGRGLGSMRRRAAEIGAELRVDSAPGRGTGVTLLFPLRMPSPPRSLPARMRLLARRARMIMRAPG